MALLTSVVTALTVIVALQLLITLALVRRVRLIQETAMFHGDSSGYDPAGGSPIGDFREVDEAGAEVTPAAFGGTSLVAFFSTSCSRCPVVAGELASHPPSEPLLAFIVAEADGSVPPSLREPLAGLARIVVIGRTSETLHAFGVEAFPTLMRISDGVVVKAGGRPRQLGLGQPLGALGPAA